MPPEAPQERKKGEGPLHVSWNEEKRKALFLAFSFGGGGGGGRSPHSPSGEKGERPVTHYYFSQGKR